jgi:hypothetical protein
MFEAVRMAFAKAFLPHFSKVFYMYIEHLGF